jgi:hypothetical protein
MIQTAPPSQQHQHQQHQQHQQRGNKDLKRANIRLRQQ